MRDLWKSEALFSSRQKGLFGAEEIKMVFFIGLLPKKWDKKGKNLKLIRQTIYLSPHLKVFKVQISLSTRRHKDIKMFIKLYF